MASTDTVSLPMHKNRESVDVSETFGANDIETVEKATRSDVNPGLCPVDGWRWAILVFSLCLGLLLAVIETSISATALVTIGRYFDDFPNSTWVILSYLLGYLGFAIVFPRLGDIIGHRNAALVAWALFSAFSIGSGLSRSLIQLIICRAFQGVGGTGLYAMTMIVAPQITPVNRWPLMSSLIGVVLGVASVCGPIVGGVITQKSTWRWIYLFNAPVAVIGVLPLILFWPTNNRNAKRQQWKNVDVVGALLIIAASCLLAFVLNQAGAAFYRWNDKVIIVCLTVSAACWCLFVCWIWFLSKTSFRAIDPIFPGKIAAKKPSGIVIIVAFLVGFPFFAAVIHLAERFQLVNGLTPIGAGVRLLPMLASVAIGSGVGGAFTKKRNLTQETLIAGSMFILPGCGLLSTLSDSKAVETKQYGFQVLLGLGFGLMMVSMTLMINIENEPRYLAAAQGAINQARMMGGITALAVATIILNQHVTTALSGLVSESQLQSIRQSLGSLETLDTTQRALVVRAFAESFNKEMRICCYVSIFTVLASIATWTRNKTPLPVRKEVKN